MIARAFRILIVLAANANLAGASALKLDEVLSSVRSHYPPLLAAWLRQDMANGRVRQAQGAFDPIVQSNLRMNPLNYYDGTSIEFLLEQPLTTWGGGIYGGYRLGTGFLPDYERKLRTAEGGEAILGMRVPLLRDGDFDSRRANLDKAALDRELANPAILRQYLTFHRGARICYFSWLAAGRKLAVAEKLLEVAKQRDAFFAASVKEGAMAPILQVDNRRLVVSREVSVLQARRGFEAASIELSLFYRQPGSGEPRLPGRQQLPEAFPEPTMVSEMKLVSDRGRAAFLRPEPREIKLLIDRGKVDRRLALNNLKPNLDLAMELNQEIGGGRPSDIERTEMTGLLKFSVPIDRDEAKGRLEAINAELARLEKEKQFIRDRIHADANDAFSAVTAAFSALSQTRLNVRLAQELEAAENERFKAGATDLLALQIREQATFDAQVMEIDALNAYFKAMADYQAAVADDAPRQLLPNGN